MTDSIASATSSPAASLGTAAAAGGGKPLDKEAFLKLLVAQISHQDPLKPMEGTEFVSQLSQFAMVEQAIAQSTHLDTLSTQLGGIANNDATSLAGKTVTMRGHSMAFDGITAASSAVTLEGAATKVSADVIDSNGQVVRTIQLGGRPAGALPVMWDGKDASGNSSPKGTYTLRINATAADGSAVRATQDVVGTVAKVSFEKGYPELTLDSGATGSISDLVSVQSPAPAPTSPR